jgi:hypothetical protein
LQLIIKTHHCAILDPPMACGRWLPATNHDHQRPWPHFYNFLSLTTLGLPTIFAPHLSSGSPRGRNTATTKSPPPHHWVSIRIYLQPHNCWNMTTQTDLSESASCKELTPPNRSCVLAMGCSTRELHGESLILNVNCLWAFLWDTFIKSR